jgi:transcriptional regulator GlxA family with amidase domain
VARALRLIRERPEYRWSVPKMAAAVGLSRSAFAERFRAATGETPIHNLTRYRLNRAAEYLRTTSSGLQEIARLVGYDSEVSISKAFRRHFGTSPGAYRRAASAG